jgi:hypothetical protein
MRHAWVATSLRRFYPGSEGEACRSLTLEVARGERAAFQVAFRTGDLVEDVECFVQSAAGLSVTVRRVGYVPLRHFSPDTPIEDLDGVGHVPGFVPDPLFPDAVVHAGPFETHSFWVSVDVAVEIEPGRHTLRAVLQSSDDTRVDLDIDIAVHAAVVPAREGFHVTQWLYADALADWYRVTPFSEPFWRILRPYLDDYARHGADTIYVPLFTPPLDGVKRPTQLVRIEPDGGDLRFEWDTVRRWIQECRSRGVTTFEWSHLFSQWGAAHPVRVYEGHGETGRLLWAPETSATSVEYRDFLTRFLPAFERFLQVEDLMPHSLFHLSDEPEGDVGLDGYRAARALVAERAPWMRVIDALSDRRFAAEALVDEPVALLPEVPAFVGDGFPAWAYFCCIPRGRFLNRLLDTPLAKVRMSGWLLHWSGVKGFLHWGYNYWYRRQTTELIDPYQVADAGAWPQWPAGDTFQVYPGHNGPIDSMRWEVFAASLQDLALLRGSAVGRDHPIFAETRNFAEFPREERWIDESRRTVLARLAQLQSRV